MDFPVAMPFPVRLLAGLFLVSAIIPFPAFAGPEQGDGVRPLPPATAPDAASAGGIEMRDENIVMAFGDSLTAGEVQPSYPEILAVLAGKTVTNDGDYGSTAAAGVRRAPGVIIARNGSRMLVLYGINDLLFHNPPREIASSIDHILHVCLSRGVAPILATYPIPILGHARFADATFRLNDLIRHLARSRGIPLADLEKLFMKDGEPNPDLYLEDGLHPSRQGNKVIAHAFAALL